MSTPDRSTLHFANLLDFVRQGGHTTADDRIKLIHGNGRQLADTASSVDERAIIDEILGLLAADAEVRVRQALAEALADSRHVSPDVILTLANDTDLVALPVLTASPVLGDKDLVEIASKADSQVKLGAIAQRENVSAAVSDILADKGSEQVVIRLLRNASARISERALGRVVDRFPASEDVQEGIVARDILPANIVERLVAMLSRQLLDKLVDRHDVAPATAVRLAFETRDRATLGLSAGLGENALGKLVEQLNDEARLSPSLLMRAICTGNFELLIHAIALRSHVSVQHVRERVLSGKEEDIARLWAAARMPTELLLPARIAVATLIDSQDEATKWDPGFYQNRIVERVVTALEAASLKFSDDLVSECISRTRGHPRQLDFVE